MTANGRIRFAIAALAASFFTGLALPERELIFYLMAGGLAGYLSPVAKRWVSMPVSRVAGGCALGFLVCYTRVIPWLGSSVPSDLLEIWGLSALVFLLKALVIFAAMEGVYLRLREEGLLGA